MRHVSARAVDGRASDSVATYVSLAPTAPAAERLTPVVPSICVDLTPLLVWYGYKASNARVSPRDHAVGS